MPICSIDDKRICGVLTSPRDKTLDTAPDAPMRPMHPRASFEPRSIGRPLASCEPRRAPVLRQQQQEEQQEQQLPLAPRIETLGLTSSLSQTMLIDEVRVLGERMESLENMLRKKADKKEVQEENAARKLLDSQTDAHTALGNIIASFEGLPEVMRAATHDMVKENVHAHARLQNLLQRLERHAENSIGQDKQNVVNMKDEFEKIHKAIQDSFKEPVSPTVLQNAEAAAVIVPDARINEVLTPKTQSRCNKISLDDIVISNQDEAADTVWHMTNKMKHEESEFVKRREALVASFTFGTWAKIRKWRKTPQNEFARFVEGDIFSSIISFVIISNTCVLGIQANESVTKAARGDFGEDLICC